MFFTSLIHHQTFEDSNILPKHQMIRYNFAKLLHKCLYILKQQTVMCKYYKIFVNILPARPIKTTSQANAQLMAYAGFICCWFKKTVWLKLHPQTHPTDPIFITKILRLSDGMSCKEVVV